MGLLPDGHGSGDAAVTAVRVGVPCGFYGVGLVVWRVVYMQKEIVEF